MRLLAAFSLVWLCSCSTIPLKHATTPAAHFTFLDGQKIDQKGPANSPSIVKVETASQSLPVPANTSVSISPSGSTSFTLPEMTEFHAQSRTECFTAPTAFPPPSPAEIASANAVSAGVQWFFKAGLVLLLAGGLALYLAHYKAGVILCVAAIVVPLVGKAIGTDIAMHALVGAVCIAGTLIVAYYLMKGNLPFHLSEEIEATRKKAVAFGVTLRDDATKAEAAIKADAASVEKKISP
jgi:hypothetical protein